MDIATAKRVSVEEMKAYYAENFPFEPNNQRVGRYAKTIGFQLTKQMINGKYIRFYIRSNNA